MTTRSERARDRGHRFIVAVALALVVAMHAPLIVFGRYANVDEAYASALGERLTEGYRLYQGAVSQRGPLMYYFYEALDACFGWDRIRAIRAMGLALGLAHVILVWKAGRTLFGRGVGAVAALVCAYAITLGFDPVDGLAVNGESLQVPFVLGGLLIGSVAMTAPMDAVRRRLGLAAAGLLFGCAVAIKQSAGLVPLPLLVWIAVDGLRTRRYGRNAVDLVVCGAAMASPAVFFLVRAAIDGTLGDLWFYCVTYNLRVHRGAARFAEWYRPLRDHLRGHTAYFYLVALAVSASAIRCGRSLRAARRAGGRAFASAFGVEDYVDLTAFAALVGAAALPQHFGHYYLLPLPLLVLAVASAARPALASPGRAARLAVSAACALTLVYGAVEVYEESDAGGLVTHDRDVLAAAEYVEGATSEADKVFVWGFSPWLYGYSHRRPAGRFVFETYVTGFVPLQWGDLAQEAARVVPGSMAQLLGDLDRERPALVIDAGSVEIARPMRAYPAASRWLRDHYCFDARVGRVDVYRRRVADSPCPTELFPCPLPPTTHWGEPLFVPMPPVADPEGSALLPPGPADEPIRFTRDARPGACL